MYARRQTKYALETLEMARKKSILAEEKNVLAEEQTRIAQEQIRFAQKQLRIAQDRLTTISSRLGLRPRKFVLSGARWPLLDFKETADGLRWQYRRIFPVKQSPRRGASFTQG